MALAFDDLITPATADEVRESIYSVLATIGVTTTNWKPGAVVRTIITAVAIILAAFSALIAAVARGGYLDLASGFWLTLLARYMFGVERAEATFASGTVLLTNTGGGTFAFAPSELTVKNTITGKTYRNTAEITIGVLEANVSAAVVALESGSDSSALAGEIDGFESPQTDLTVTNPLALVGVDEQEDDPLRQQCRDKLGSLSPHGPSDAYSYAAKNALRLDGSPINITRTRIVPDGFGGVDLYVGTASGGVTGSSEDPTTDLGAANEAAQVRAVPLAVTLRTWSAIESPITVELTHYVLNSTGLTEAQVQAADEAAVVEYFSAVPVGGLPIVDGDFGAIFISGGLDKVIANAVPGTIRTTFAEPSTSVDGQQGALMSLFHVPVLASITVAVVLLAPGAL